MFAVALVVTAIGVLQLSGKQAPANHAARPAPVALAQHGRLVAAGGLVEPASEARQLEATVVGRILKMSVNEGDHVVEGDVIAEIENGDLKAQLTGAEAALVARQSELTRLKAGPREQEIAEARASAREAEAIALAARSNFERKSALGKTQLVSKQDVDQALADRDAAEARRLSAAARLSLMIAPPRVEDLAIAQANYDAAKAHLEEVKASLDKTLVKSPIDGTILKLYRRTGETVSNLPPTPIATVGDVSHLRIRADVDQADVAQIAMGQTVWVTADAYPDQQFRGTVARVSAQLGRKNFHNDRPEERVDTKILEVLIDLDADVRLPIGLPVDVILDDSRTSTEASNAEAKVKLSASAASSELKPGVGQ
jgi:HlyD family secretion protein